MTDEKPKPLEYGAFNTDPRSRHYGYDYWAHEQGSKMVTPEQAAAGWRPMAEVPKNRYVALLFRDSTGEFEGSAAYYLEEDQWHVAKSKMIFRANTAIAWKRWTRQGLEAQPDPPKGRRG